MDLTFTYIQKNKYNVRSSYDYLISMEHNVVSENTNFIWHKVAALKVSHFAWKMLRNRIHTSDNLSRREFPKNSVQLCVGRL